MNNKVVLIGPPGAGKTSIGKSLAKEMGLAFIDSDSEIEKKMNKKISEIFVENGEDFFRQVEVEVVTDLLNRFDGVIALGGGAPINKPLS